MSRQGESLASVTLDQIRIPQNNKRNKTPACSVQRKEPIRDTVNPRKISQEDNVADSEKGSQHKTPQPFWNKEDYEVDTDERNCFTDDSWTGNDDCVRNLDKEKKNEEDEELQKYSSVVNMTNELKWNESKKEQALIKRLLAINLPIKIIQSIIISANSCEQKMTEIGNKNEKLQAKIDGIIVIIFEYFHCWGLIIVYLYYSWLGVFLGFMKQVNVLMSLRLYIWLIQYCMFINPPKK